MDNFMCQIGWAIKMLRHLVKYHFGYGCEDASV